MVRSPGDWLWSSYRAHVGEDETPGWLDTAGLHGYLLDRPADTAADRRTAASRYARLVDQGRGEELWQEHLRQQIYLGDESFVARMQALAEPQRTRSPAVPRAQRAAPKSLPQWLAECDDRGEALRRAFREGGLSMTAMAASLGLSVSRVSRLISRAEAARSP